MQFESWVAFCSIAFIATITPGPAILLVTTHSLQFGIKKSLPAIVGNISGLFAMSTFSVLGLSAIVAYSSTAFTAIKIMGAIYLFYLGIKLWRNGLLTDVNTKKGLKSTRLFNLYTQGLLVSLTNPKAIVFTTALFPQFIVISEPLIPQFTILITTFMALSALCLFAYSYLAKRTKSHSLKFLSEKNAGKYIGAGFIGAGTVLLTSSQR